MAGEKDAHDERMRELRERLYSRGTPPTTTKRIELHDEPLEVSTSWKNPEEARDRITKTVEAPTVAETPLQAPLIPMQRKKKAYRRLLIIAGLVFFVVALVLSGSYFIIKPPVSNDNISITMEGPFAIGGGQDMPMKISIANNNAVAIESATLIIEYPLGTQSLEGKEMFQERRPLDVINPGGVLNVEAKARVFGEENEEKTIRTSIEYRVKGSNAIFIKDAEPLRFKISSSPVSLTIENITKGASGQDVELEIAVTSNSPSVLENLLIKAEYPFGFDFVDSTPKPVSGRDIWKIEKLEPEGTAKVRVSGVVSGKESDTRTFRFSVGVPSERDQFALASVFMSQTEEVNIEKPFLDVAIGINDQFDAEASVAPGTRVRVAIVFTNTLSATIYDGKITADLSGNGLSPSQVRAGVGFYDSATNIITWDSQTVDTLRSIAPGRSSKVNFDIEPSSEVGRTPQITITANAEGNRVLENNVQQKLTGIATKIVKVTSAALLSSKILYSGSEFVNTGPVPPRAEEVTTYSVVWSVRNGTNEITDGVVVATLPSYVTWLDLSTASNVFSYNPQTRQVAWKVGDLDARQERSAAFQISLRPSQSQVGREVTLINAQRLTATDRFTGTMIRSDSSALTTELSEDPEYADESGDVRPKSTKPDDN